MYITHAPYSNGGYYSQCVYNNIPNLTYGYYRYIVVINKLQHFSSSYIFNAYYLRVGVI